MSESAGTNTLSVTDNRTGKTYEIPIEDGAIKASAIRQIKTDQPDDQGLLSFDPAFTATASCRSAITFIDGDAGILRYRGYPIDTLAENSGFLEVAYLLMNGDLPNADQRSEFEHAITNHTFVHQNVKKFMEASTTTPTRWACWWGRSARCRRSTPRPRTSGSRSTGACRWPG
jgi:citrate synthase